MEGKARSRSTGRFLVLVAAMLAVAVLSQQSWAAGVRGTAKSALAPLEAQMMSLPATVERGTAAFGDIASLPGQNQKLPAENPAMKRQLAELNAAPYHTNEPPHPLHSHRSP